MNANTFGRYWNYHEATPPLQKFSYRIFWTFWQFATGKILQCINIKVEIFRKFIIVCGSCGKILSCVNCQTILKTATVTGGGKACVLNPHGHAPRVRPLAYFFQVSATIFSHKDIKQIQILMMFIANIILPTLQRTPWATDRFTYSYNIKQFRS